MSNQLVHRIFPSTFCMSIRLSGYEREITMMSTLILYDTQGFLPSSSYPNPQSHKYQFQLTSLFCMSMTSMRIGKRKTTPLFCMSITIMRLGKRNNHDIYFTFLYDTRFCCFLLLPKTSIWDSIQTINTSVQSTCMYDISSCYHFSVWV